MLRLKLENGTVWPNPASEDVNNITWKMIHSPDTVTKNEMMTAASIIEAYQYLIVSGYTLARVQRIVSMIRKAIRNG